MEEMRTLYDKYRTDSAIVYASKALSIAEKIGERSLIDRSLAGLAKEFGTSQTCRFRGFYKVRLTSTT